MHLLISLYERYIQILFLDLNWFSFLRFFGWWFFFFEDFIRSTGFIGQDLADHKLVIFVGPDIFYNFGSFSIQLGSGLKVIFF